MANTPEQPILNPLVNADWLKQRIDDSHIRLFDATLAPIGVTLDPQNKRYLPSTQVIDIEGAFSVSGSDLPHTMISAEQFEKVVQTLGVNQDSIVVIYDDIGLYSAARAWWMFKLMGHSQVYVLNGGLPAWEKAGFETVPETGKVKEAGNFKAHFQADWICDSEQVLELLNNPLVKIIDARSEGRFNGTAPEPRAGLRSGHIPGSTNMPFTLLTSENGFKPIDKLAEQFHALNTENSQRLVFSCGSGITASILLLAAYCCGYKNLSVYDGSWSEWGQRTDLPIE